MWHTCPIDLLITSYYVNKWIFQCLTVYEYRCLDVLSSERHTSRSAGPRVADCTPSFPAASCSVGGRTDIMWCLLDNWSAEGHRMTSTPSLCAALALGNTRRTSPGKRRWRYNAKSTSMSTITDCLKFRRTQEMMFILPMQPVCQTCTQKYSR